MKNDLVKDIIECGIQNHQGNKESCSGLQVGNPVKGCFHLPDPWNGNIETARLLIVGINPGYDPLEYYPSLGDDIWMDGQTLNYDRIGDFFKNRFGRAEDCPIQPSYYVGVGEGRDHGSYYIPRRNGGGPNRYRSYWRYATEIADFVLGNNPVPRIGVDYVLTELVHCKTKNVGNIPNECYKECFNRFFDRIVAAAGNLETIVIVGGWGRHLCKEHWEDSIFLNNTLLKGDEVNDHMYEKLSLRTDGRNLNLYFADHNNGRGLHHGTIQRFIDAQ